ncbi:MAG: DUF7121 family protein, partial [Nanoarchaeota archaeon]
DARALKKEMESIKFKLETEPMSFTAEQKLMKRVKEIKKILENSSDNSELSSNIKSLSKEIDDLKKEADEVHKVVQESAVESQKKHEEMIQFSKKIDDLKVKEEEAYKTFTKYKDDFVALNNKLKEKFKELAPLTKKLDSHKIETSDKRQKTMRLLLKKNKSLLKKRSRRAKN